MKKRTIALLVMMGCLGAGSGYWYRGVELKRQHRSEVKIEVPEDYPSVDSFSEIENTKAALNGLAHEYVAEAFSRHAAALIGHTGPGTNRVSLRKEHMRQYILELHDGIAKFRGTEQEMRLTHTLLVTLKGEELHQEWLKVYVDTLYRHPMDELVGSFASQAASIARSVGRQPDVCKAFQHVLQVPFAFDIKTRVQEVCQELCKTNQVTWSGGMP